MRGAVAVGQSVADSPDELQHLRTEVRDFVHKAVADGRFLPQCDSWLTGWDPGFSRELGARGWIGMTIPAAYGGAGRSQLARYVVAEELLSAGAPVAAHWIADRQVAPSLIRYGTDAQKARYLPAISAGDCYFAIGMSEPESGSDLASVRTRAKPAPGGWIIEGSKIWTSGAHHAHAFFVLARTASVEEAGSRHQGLSQFLVPLDSPGVTVRPILLMTGEHHFNEVWLDEVFVPDDMVVGKIGTGWQQVTAELAIERSGPERFLSTYPLLAALGQIVAARGDAEGRRAVSRLMARLWVLRHMSMAVAEGLATQAHEDLSGNVVKDLGTRFEGDVVEEAHRQLGIEADATSADELARMLALGTLHAPGFTLRGGTNEILRGLTARSLGLQ
jgi:alkylation response protein AidB-like acyl-CoA dehydrogenase